MSSGNEINLENIEIPDSVTSIGKYAFCGCTNLENFTIPNSVTSIGLYAFDNTAWYENQPNGIICAGKTIYRYKGEMPKNTSITIPSYITSIGDGAFGACLNLESVTLPDSVTNIGESAFSSCTNLKNVEIPDSITNIGNFAFSNCTNLENITIPDNAINISPYAFSYSTNLKSIEIPDSVTSIGCFAFEHTAWYDNQPNGMVYAGKTAYHYKGVVPENTSITILDGTKSICDYAFYGYEINPAYTNLTSVVIPDSVTSIGEQAFRGCTGLKNINLSENLTNIGKGAFSGCINLEGIEIPDSVTSIGDSAFYDCRSITSLTIPNGITNINKSAFSHCYSLTEVVIPDSVTSIDEAAFYFCTGLKSVTIPKSVTSICDFKSGEWDYVLGAFGMCTAVTIYGCPNTAAETYALNNSVPFAPLDGSVPKEFGYILLDDGTAEIVGYIGSKTTVNIPAEIDGYKVTSIRNGMFYGYTNLESVTLPDGLKNIGDGAFYDCTSLKSITIPASVTNIGYNTLGYYTGIMDFGDWGTALVDGFTIYGNYYTEAERYALENRITFISSESTRYTVFTLVMLTKYMNGNIKELNVTLYDMNSDGVINVIDTALLRRNLLKGF